MHLFSVIVFVGHEISHATEMLLQMRQKSYRTIISNGVLSPICHAMF